MKKLIENAENEGVFRSINDNTQFKKTVKDISRVVRANHFSYEQLKYIFSGVRQKCGLKAKKRNKGIKDHLSQEELSKVLSIAYSKKGEMGLLIKTLLFTGARVTEFVNIMIKDVYISEKKIYLRETKGDKPRFVPVFDFYLRELMQYIGDRKEGYLFETRLHDKYSARRIQQILKGFVNDAGVQKAITPHRMRATIATWLSEKGMPTEDIQQFLGHEKLETTQIYTKGAVRNLGESATKLLEKKETEEQDRRQVPLN